MDVGLYPMYSALLDCFGPSRAAFSPLWTNLTNQPALKYGIGQVYRVNQIVQTVRKWLKLVQDAQKWTISSQFGPLKYILNWFRWRLDVVHHEPFMTRSMKSSKSSTPDMKLLEKELFWIINCNINYDNIRVWHTEGGGPLWAVAAGSFVALLQWTAAEFVISNVALPSYSSARLWHFGGWASRFWNSKLELGLGYLERTRGGRNTGIQ